MYVCIKIKPKYKYKHKYIHKERKKRINIIYPEFYDLISRGHPIQVAVVTEGFLSGCLK